MRILLIDNYDSFTYNLMHLLREIMTEDDRLVIVKNDELTDAHGESADKIMVSPGPGLPEEAGGLLPFLQRFLPFRAILGICLGHQALARCCGASLLNVPAVFHGVQSLITVHEPSGLFAGLPQTLQVGRYHSWCVDRRGFPAELNITAEDGQGRIMALSHARHNAHGVQFHPESFLTPHGRRILANFCGR